MRLALSIMLVLAASVAIGGVAVYSGLYSVAASEPHTQAIEKLLRGALRRSVSHHASGITAPNLAEEGRVFEGLAHYGAMCEVCHGAPDRAPSDVAEGLYPRPPQFAEEQLDWSDAELFWITKHGLKMTGMPGFGATHEDDGIWSIVAAVRRLPELDPAVYRAAATESAPAEQGAHDHTGHH